MQLFSVWYQFNASKSNNEEKWVRQRENEEQSVSESSGSWKDKALGFDILFNMPIPDVEDKGTMVFGLFGCFGMWTNDEILQLLFLMKANKWWDIHVIEVCNIGFQVSI